VLEIFVDVVPDQRLEARPPQAGMIGNVFIGQTVGENQDRRFRRSLPDHRDCCTNPRAIVARQRILVAGLGIQSLEGLDGEASLERSEAGRPRA
jgi:hypothetical protein